MIVFLLSCVNYGLEYVGLLHYCPMLAFLCSGPGDRADTPCLEGPTSLVYLFVSSRKPVQTMIKYAR